MLKRLLMAAILVAASSGAMAQDRVTLGWGRIFTNDQIGDGEDRWHSGSYTVSRLRGPSWSGYDGARFGEVLELRGHAAVIAPSNLVTPAANDRRYVGLLSFGLNSHFGWAGNEVMLGAELALTGPQTGVGRFQSWFHNLAGLTPPSSAVLGNQIGNQVFPGLNAEIGRSFQLGERVQARPFAQARAGVETMLRVGGDVTIGRFGTGDLLLRDATTGQRYRGVEGDRSEGLSLTLGGDIAQVFDTALIPAGGAVTASEDRYRLRAGVQWQGKRASTFYGVTYMSREFEEQPEGQLVGAMSLNLRF